MNMYQEITNLMIEKIKSGIIPWKQPYLSHMNYLHQKPYRGINRLILSLYNYKSPFWLTFNQVTQLGGFVKKHSKAAKIVFWNICEDEDENTFVRSRLYSVFNIDQVEGIEFKLPETPIRAYGVNPLEFLNNYPTVESNNSKTPCYSPSLDKIFMPEMKFFQDEISYYSTLFHELVHSTGHANRLKREGVTDPVRFGSHTYSVEELVAEMGSSFLNAEFGYQEQTIDQSAAYIASWLNVLKSNPKYIFQASSKAQAAVDYLLGNFPRKVE